jgi:coenzyme PQQ precursor peptide PqqA
MFQCVLGTILSPTIRILNLGIKIMAWTTPILVEICIGLEINGYLPAEF